MKRTRRNHSPAFKARIGLEALKGRKTVAEIARENKLHSTQVSQWKTEVQKRLPEVFELEKSGGECQQEKRVEDLYAQIGKLTVELDWLRKKSKALGL